MKISEVKVIVNNLSIKPELLDGFLTIGQLYINDLALLSYPRKSNIKEEKIAAGDFSFTYQGSTVMRAEPGQKFGEYFTNFRFTSEPPVFEVNPMEEIDSL